MVDFFQGFVFVGSVCVWIDGCVWVAVSRWYGSVAVAVAVTLAVG